MIGVDVIEVSRISKAVKKHGDHFLNKIFDPSEVEYCYRHKNPAPHLAARFAAKEAVFKALSQTCKDLTWRQIIVERKSDGRPVCRVVHPKFKGMVSVSLSHTKTYAVACALIQKKKQRSQK